MVDKKKFTDFEHPEYSANLQAWLRFMRAYRGGMEFAKSALIQNAREDLADFQKRQKRAVPMNFCNRIPGERTAFLVRETPVIDAPSKTLALVNSNVDRQGNTLIQLLPRISDEAQVTGTLIAVVDKKPLGVIPVTRADQEELNDTPYLTLLPATALQNFAVDDTGALTWALLKQPDQVEQFVGGEIVVESNPATWILWTPEYFQYFNSEGVGGEQFPNVIKAVPVVPIFFHRIGNDFYGTSVLTDIEGMNEELIRLLSDLGENVHKQCFGLMTGPPLFIQAVKKGDGDSEKRMEVSRSTYLEIPAGAKQSPQYISPPAANIMAILAYVEELIGEIYAIGQLKRPTARKGGELASGYAKALDLLDTNASIGKMARDFEASLDRVLWLFGRWNGEPDNPEDYSIRWPSDFGTTTASDLVDEVVKLNSSMQLDTPNEVSATYLKAIMKQRFPELSADEQAQLARMIDAKMVGDFQAALPPPGSVEVEAEVETE